MKKKFKTKLKHKILSVIIILSLIFNMFLNTFAQDNSKSNVIQQPQNHGISIYDTFESKHYDISTPSNPYYKKDFTQNNEYLGTKSNVVFGVGINILPGDNVGTTFQKNGTATSLSEKSLHLGTKKENTNYFITYTIRGIRYSKAEDIINTNELLEGNFVFEYDGKQAIILPLPQGKGQVFAGWFDNPEYNGKKIESLPNFLYKNVDLYAKFVNPTK